MMIGGAAVILAAVIIASVRGSGPKVDISAHIAVKVTTGISDATHVAVLSGVKVGDENVTGPFRTSKKLNDGEIVEVTREEKKTSKDEDES
jgi:hypothetical protein